MKSIICLFSFSFSVLVAQQDPKAEAVLIAMSKKYEAYKSYQAKFEYELENTQAKVKDKFVGEIKVKGQKFTVNLGSQVIFNDGKTVWTYLKDENEVNVSDYKEDDDALSPTKIYSMYKSGYKYLHVGVEKINKVSFDMIELVPENKNKPYFKIKLWISKKDKSISKWRIFEKNGNRYNYLVSNFIPNLKFEDVNFVFDKAKYEGVEVVDLR